MLSSSRVSFSVAAAASATLNPPSPSRLLPRFLNSRFLGKKNISHLSNPIRWNSRMEVSRTANFSARASAQPLKNADELIDSVETFIFDCDGELVISGYGSQGEMMFS